MSKKSGKGKKSKNYDESEELSGFVTNTQDTTNNVLDIGYLTGAILDYYEVTGAPLSMKVMNGRLELLMSQSQDVIFHRNLMRL